MSGYAVLTRPTSTVPSGWCYTSDVAGYNSDASIWSVSVPLTIDSIDHMSLNYQFKIIADARCTGVHLQDGIGLYLLRFSISFDVKAHPDQRVPFRFENVRARVFAGAAASSKQRFLGNADPEAPILIRTGAECPLQIQLLFDVAISAPQLEALEVIRNGGDLYFRLHLYGESYGAYDPSPASDDISVHVNQAEWIRILGQAGFAEIVLFEVPLPAQSDNGILKSAVDHLRKARDLFLAGHYVESVAKCRLAIESCEKAKGDEQQQSGAVKAYCDKRMAMSTSERLLLIRAAVKHYTQLAHHDLDNGVSCFCRSDASLILGMTAGLLAHAQAKC